MLKTVFRHSNLYNSTKRLCSTVKTKSQANEKDFETVFSFPFIRYIGVVSRLKVYQLLGTAIMVPGSGLLETLNVVPSGAFLSASVIGLSTAAVMSLVTFPFRNIIGFIYINKDNETIKISYLDYWGRRKDKVVTIDKWTPLFELKPKAMDPIYLTPDLSDGIKYKLFIKFGQVLNSEKLEKYLE